MTYNVSSGTLNATILLLPVYGLDLDIDERHGASHYWLFAAFFDLTGMCDLEARAGHSGGFKG